MLTLLALGHTDRVKNIFLTTSSRKLTDGNILLKLWYSTKNKSNWSWKKNYLWKQYSNSLLLQSLKVGGRRIQIDEVKNGLPNNLLVQMIATWIHLNILYLKDGFDTRKNSTKPDMKLRYCFTNTNYSYLMVAPPTQLWSSKSEINDKVQMIKPDSWQEWHNYDPLTILTKVINRRPPPKYRAT